MIESTGARNKPIDSLPGREAACLFDQVKDRSFFVFEDVDDLGGIQLADVIGLSAAGRVKCGLIESDLIAAFGGRSSNHDGRELQQV